MPAEGPDPKSPADPRTAPEPGGDPAWTAYGDTALDFPDACPPLGLDLRQPITAGAAARATCHVGAPAFGVVTPANPGGTVLPAAENASRVAALAAWLTSAGFPHVRADGRDPAATHVEHGFAIVAPRETIRAIAARHGQTAFYWFDGAAAWLVPTHPGHAALPLPVPSGALARARTPAP